MARPCGIFFSIMIVLSWLAVEPARAQDVVQNTDWCDNAATPDFSFDQKIQGCTTIIESSTASSDKRARAFNIRGLAYFNLKQYSLAIADFNESLRLKPDNYLTFLNRGEAHQYSGEYDLAIADFSETIRLNPGESIGYVFRCMIRSKSGDRLDMALSDCGKALELSANMDCATCKVSHSQAALWRALIWFRMGRFQNAIDDCDSASDQFSRGYALYLRGLSKRKLGDTAAGAADIAAAKAMLPGVALTYAKYGITP
jgi:tetratricopeptide (TPR) repeat protein